ncbi:MULTISPECIES: M14 family metallopeptidase [Bacillus]|uniref:M14 family metallopeptidase n=1 Tax=Bacillus TaxID=1386 RepID=UPI001581C2EC|nr:M14 family metallocarboxypeptidase [Bacillus glycinifermentans]MBU8786680.1 M14 family metallocarboxypeptidase [Bacillus glycinifermentans]NUJ16598.1 peptidase M14 [Bacillus glycinifermentans]
MNIQKRVQALFGISLLLGGLMLSGVVHAADTPYYGKLYTQPEQLSSLYPEPRAAFQTPAFVKDDEAFTTQEEMMRFITRLTKKSPNVKMKNIGFSIEKRAIPVLYFTKDDRILSVSNKPTIWLEAQIHGNEPASGESALAIAEKLAGPYGDKVLQKVNVIIVPRINPDGSYQFTRKLASGIDANRDHVKLESPELRALHREFNKYSPEVVIDAHEYGVGQNEFQNIGEKGALKYHDLLILSGKNLNIPEGIRSASDSLFVNGVREKLSEKGFSNDFYYTTGKTEDGKIEIYEGGPEARIGRNAFALQPALSFLVESRGIDIGRENFKRRVAAQVTTHKTIIDTTVKHAAEIKHLVASEKWKLNQKGAKADDKDQVVIKSDFAGPFKDTLKMADIASGQAIDVPVQYYNSSQAVPVLSRTRPVAYLVLPGHEDIDRKLKDQGLKSAALRFKQKLSAEAYQVTSKETAGESEGRPVVQVETALKHVKKEFPKGTKVYVTAQPQTNLLSIALEPESVDSFVSTGYISSEKGKELPVYRFMLDQKALHLQK